MKWNGSGILVSNESSASPSSRRHRPTVGLLTPSGVFRNRLPPSDFRPVGRPRLPPLGSAPDGPGDCPSHARPICIFPPHRLTHKELPPCSTGPSSCPASPPSRLSLAPDLRRSRLRPGRRQEADLRARFPRQGHRRQGRRPGQVQGQGPPDREHGQPVRQHSTVQGPPGDLREVQGPGIRGPGLPGQRVRRPGAGRQRSRSRSSARPSTRSASRSSPRSSSRARESTRSTNSSRARRPTPSSPARSPGTSPSSWSTGRAR